MKLKNIVVGALALAMTAAIADVSQAQPRRRPFSRIVEFFGGKQATATYQPLHVGAARSTEIAIQLAWLADPVTFPYSLAAHVQQDSVAVHGFVPSDSVRRQAIRIAQKQTRTKVVDVLKVDRGVQIERVSKSRRELMQSAAAVLRKSFPDAHRAFYLNSTSDGRLYIRGTVPSSDAKLLVSESLRNLPGCACVVNQLKAQGRQMQQTQRVQSPPQPTVTQTGEVQQTGIFSRAFNRLRRMARGEPDHQKLTNVEPQNSTQGSTWRTSVPSNKKPKYRVVGNKSSKRVPAGVASRIKDIPKGAEIVSVDDVKQSSKPVPAGINTRHLQRRIQSVAGNRLRNLKVTRSNQGKLVISCELVSPGREQEVIEQVFALPELAPYQQNIELEFPTAGPPSRKQ